MKASRIRHLPLLQRPSSSVLALLLCVGFTAGKVPSAPADGPQGADYGEPRLLVGAPEGSRYQHLSWPKIVTAPDGTLVLAYSAGIGHNIGGSGPAVSISTDRGKTFTPPHILRRFPDDDERYRDCGNMAMGIAQDGAIVLLAMAFNRNEANTILGWRSTDSGKTWTPVDTSRLADNRTGSVYGHVFQVPGKGLTVIGHYRRPGRPHPSGLWISYSSDYGKTWGDPQAISTEALVEPAVIFTENRFVGLIRESPGRQYWQLTSDDLGETWDLRPSTVASPGHENYRFPSPFIAAHPSDPSRLYAFESNRHVPGNVPGRIVLWTADAGTLEWERRGVVVRFPESAMDHRDFTYPWMTPLDEETWFMVFYSGKGRGENSIYGMEINPN